MCRADALVRSHIDSPLPAGRGRPACTNLTKSLKITQEVSPAREMTLTVEVPPEETAPRFAEAIEKYRRTASLPGFRPGKAPLDMVKRRYGPSIIADAADDLAREFLEQAFKSEKIVPAGRISLDLKSYGEDRPLTVVAVFPLPPIVHLVQHRGLKVVVSEPAITETDIDRQIELLRIKNAHLHSIDGPAPTEAIVDVRYREVDPSGLPLLGRRDEEKQIEFGTDALGIGSDEQLIGIKTGEARTIRVRRAGGGIAPSPMVSRILSPSEAAGRSAPEDGFVTLRVEAVAVAVPHLPEVDEDLARQVDEHLTSVEDLRHYVRSMLLSYVGHHIQHEFEDAVIDQLLAANPIDLPRGVVEFRLEEIAEEANVPPGEQSAFIERHLEEANRDYRWMLLQNAVADAEGITVSDEEVEEELRRISEQTGESIEATARRFGGEEGRSRLQGRMFEHRVISTLAQHASIEKRPLGLDEFMRQHRDH
ncbi:MAG: trigger factor [Calditrichaeota bacterium]|nr:trigger factor [Calditrichota bacterium]